LGFTVGDTVVVGATVANWVAGAVVLAAAVVAAGPVVAGAAEVAVSLPQPARIRPPIKTTVKVISKSFFMFSLLLYKK